MTYDLDVVGHPSQRNSLLNKSFPGIRSKHLVARQHHVELSEAAEEEGGQGGGQEGQVLAEPLLQWPAVVFALKNLLDKCSMIIIPLHCISNHLGVVSEKSPPVEGGDNMAYQEKADRGDEKVVEIETLKIPIQPKNLTFYLIRPVRLLHHHTVKMMEDCSYV